MATTIGNLLPIAVVAAAVTWLCYPYLNEPGSEPAFQHKANPPSIAGRLLSPVIGPASDRDPFKPWRASARSEQTDVAAGAGKFPRPDEKAFDVSNKLTLTATYVQGNRRLALINGQVCEPGDGVRISGPITEPCTVTQVFADRVMLLHGDQIVELKYRDLAAITSPAKPSEPRHE